MVLSSIRVMKYGDENTVSWTLARGFFLRKSTMINNGSCLVQTMAFQQFHEGSNLSHVGDRELFKGQG